MPSIEAHDLAKLFQYHQKEPGLAGSIRALFHRQTLERVAVDGVSFAVEPGEFVGFLGPNGAGKTTTLKMLCGLLHPSRGEARVLGHVPSRREHAFLRQIALVMGQKGMLWWDLPAIEMLLVQQDLYGLPDREFRRSLDELAEMLEVGHLLGVQVRKLSLGERMKMELLAALIHRPRVLFLDEPTIGLDLISQGRVRDFLRRLNREQGTTILLTSHYMGDIEELCRRVIVINQGRLYFDGALARLVEQAAPSKLVTAVFAEPPPLPGPDAGQLGRPGHLPHRDTPPGSALDAAELQPTDDPHRLVLRVPRARVADVASQLLHLGQVVDLTIEEVPVEEIVRGIFGALREEPRPAGPQPQAGVGTRA
ncbi:MAG TPA: ATP-binding cassette domain-containing protein [Chloroflexota bacterium]|jgi:ABC-2 type transport system ATP-binding protein|nr:ATP-binding cassette domain-containing protein [Chloroflexota bacterium]